MIDCLLIERGYWWRLFLLKRLVDFVIIHILHDPVGGRLQIVLVLNEGAFGSIGSEAHGDQHVHIFLRPFGDADCSLQLISHGGSRVDEEVGYVEVLGDLDERVQFLGHPLFEDETVGNGQQVLGSGLEVMPR